MRNRLEAVGAAIASEVERCDAPRSYNVWCALQRIRDALDGEKV